MILRRGVTNDETDLNLLRRLDEEKWSAWFKSLPPVHEGHRYSATDEWGRRYCPICYLEQNPRDGSGT